MLQLPCSDLPAQRGPQVSPVLGPPGGRVAPRPGSHASLDLEDRQAESGEHAPDPDVEHEAAPAPR